MFIGLIVEVGLCIFWCWECRVDVGLLLLCCGKVVVCVRGCRGVWWVLRVGLWEVGWGWVEWLEGLGRVGLGEFWVRWGCGLGVLMCFCCIFCGFGFCGLLIFFFCCFVDFLGMVGVFLYWGLGNLVFGFLVLLLDYMLEEKL